MFRVVRVVVSSRDPWQTITPGKRPPQLGTSKIFTPLLNSTYFHENTTKMPVDEVKMELALQDLRCQDPPNIKATANLYSLNRMTLSWRFYRKAQSMSESRLDNSKRLSNAQEAVLIDFINRLTWNSLPPTSQIIKNVAEELCNMTVGKNWVGDFT
jgi:Tc5 transposase DNA-binding domain